MSAVHDHALSSSASFVTRTPPPTPMGASQAPRVPPAPTHARAQQVLAAGRDTQHGANLAERNVVVLTIEDEPSPEIELVVTADGASKTPTEEFFAGLQTAEDILDRGRSALKVLQDLGVKDDFVASLSDSLDQIKAVIDRAQELKQRIDEGDVVDSATAIVALSDELRQSVEPLTRLVATAKEKAEQIKSCCSSLFSCFGRK